MSRDAGARDRAVELVVFGPLGAALLARDGVCQLTTSAVRRGRQEVERRRQDVDARLAQYRVVGQLAWTFGAPEAKRRLERLTRDARARAEETIGDVGEAARRATAGLAASGPGPHDVGEPPWTGAGPAPAPPGDAATGLGPDDVLAAPGAQDDGFDADAPVDDGWWRPVPTLDEEPAAPGHPAGAGVGPLAGETGPVEALPIPGYDELSAEQVVDRLEGLTHEELAAVRRYETRHRGRRTVLGKLDHLTAGWS